VLKDSSVKLLASFVLVAGGACMALFTFAIYLSYTLTFFVAVSTRDQILGNGSIIGAVPLIAGALLLFFHQTQRLGARLTLAGSMVLTAYLALCYARLSFNSMELVWKMLWFGLFPVVVVAVDWASYKIYRAVLPPVPARTMTANAG